MEGDTLPPAAAALPEAADITESDLIAALLEAASAADDAAGVGLSTAQLCLATGRSDKWVRRRLWRLKAAGRLVITQSMRESLSGAMVAVPVYSMAAEDNPAD